MFSAKKHLTRASGEHETLPVGSETERETRRRASRLEAIQAPRQSPADLIHRALNHFRRSVLSEELQIIGSLTAKGEVEVCGTVTGEVSCASLIVGERGRICGGVKAEEVVVDGQIDGPIEGMQVTLTSHAHVQGDIFHERLLMDEAAILKGTARQREFSEEPRPAAAA